MLTLKVSTSKITLTITFIEDTVIKIISNPVTLGPRGTAQLVSNAPWIYSPSLSPTYVQDKDKLSDLPYFK